MRGIEEQFRRVTPGLFRAIGKMQPSNKGCSNCNFPLPVYPGRYPKTCPNCGEPAIQDLMPQGESRNGTHAAAD